MWNFIKEFIEKKLENSNKNKTKDNLQNFPQSSTNLVNENKNMSDKIMDDMKETLKDEWKWNSVNKIESIKIEKTSYTKTILWILFQFFLWIFLIVYSYSYLQKHEAEMKFFDSSIQYWKNLAVNLYAKLWGSFEDQVDQDYMDKRADMVKTLSKLSIELNACIAREKNEETLKQLKSTKNDIEQLKRMLADTNYLSLNKYIEKYQYYSLWVHSLKEWVENYCRK